MTEIMKPENANGQQLELMTEQETAQAVIQVLAPVISGMNQMTQMMAQTAQQMRMMQESMERMSRAIERGMPLTGTQARMLSTAIKERAAGVKEKYGLGDEARLDCAREIRKKLCRRWAVASVKEIPRSEYELAMESVERFDESAVVLKYM